MTTLAGIQVVTSPYATRPPTPGEWARRYVRHGMSDILEWLGEPVGPEPDERLPAAFLIRTSGVMVVHPNIHAVMQDMASSMQRLKENLERPGGAIERLRAFAEQLNLPSAPPLDGLKVFQGLRL